MLNRKLNPITNPFTSNDGNYTMNLFGVDVVYQKYKLLTIVPDLCLMMVLTIQHV